MEFDDTDRAVWEESEYFDDIDGASGTTSTYDARYKGVTSLDQLGSSLGIADFDGDGTNDLAAGSALAQSGAYVPGLVDHGPVGSTMVNDVILTGSTTEYLGSALAAGDLDGDGGDPAMSANRPMFESPHIDVCDASV